MSSATSKVSGKDTIRLQFAAMILDTHKGDTVVIRSMDRLARNFDDLRSR
ncbi:hypothetical protein E4633_19185 [Geomonas terrae]|uniref:Resolvase/invertase-type recombinase catalytic domain-containing protein n=1 Tax=Geomonas terrae TaxID=2562681 RepID=A0A4S1CAM8_9BACT|nr:hypothetical protein E4633_19185 [Geomonas terrae]